MPRTENKRRSSVRLESSRRKAPSIGLTALIDVVFILLLFFMLASDLNRFNRVEIRTTEAGAAASSQGAALFLRVHGDDTYSLVDRRMEAPELIRTLSARLDSETVASIVVHPDGDVRLQALVDIIERLTELGVGSITLG